MIMVVIWNDFRPPKTSDCHSCPSHISVTDCLRRLPMEIHLKVWQFVTIARDIDTILIPSHIATQDALRCCCNAKTSNIATHR